MTRSEFERVVDRVVSSIPAAFRSHFENLVFVVEDYADAQLLAEAGYEPGEELLGFYRGYPLNERQHDLVQTEPDMIYLFQRTIEAEAAATSLPIVQVVRETVVHEVAHFFGFSEADLERFEALWAAG